jgi:hypothetical protein
MELRQQLWLANFQASHRHPNHLEFQRDQPAVKRRQQRLLIVDLLVVARTFALHFVQQNRKP